jgi:NTE family protein
MKKKLRMVFLSWLCSSPGLFSSDPLKEWIDQHLLKGRKFEAENVDDKGMPWHQQRAFKVITSDVSARRMRVLPDDLQSVYGVRPSEFEMSEAVRQSMSLPLLFVPAKQQNSANGSHSSIVDGGVLSKFPLWIFDKQRTCCTPPRCATVGFLLDEEATPEKESPKMFKNLLDLGSAIISTVFTNIDSKYVRANPQSEKRVVKIPIPAGIYTTKFTLTDADRDLLWGNGYRAAAQFIKTFDFQEHLRDRGFNLPAAQAM